VCVRGNAASGKIEDGRPSTARLRSADCAAGAEVPETRVPETRNGRIAYQVVGDGPVDVLVAHAPFCPIDLMWDEPSLVRFLDRLSSFRRHLWFDPRGRGASDPLPHDDERFAEAITDDMLALVDHLGWERVAVVGDMEPQILFAASHPERTKALVLLNAGARWARQPDPSQVSLAERLEQSRRQNGGPGRYWTRWPPAWPGTPGSGVGWGAANGWCPRPMRCTGGCRPPEPWTWARARLGPGADPIRVPPGPF
jgi:pimeloyl-ACP methyl ester carboxylesterase